MEAKIQAMLESMNLAYPPSSHQIGVFDFVKFGTGNAVIDAVAGSGKSTTIVSAMKLVDKSLRLAFLAFNKKIVTELTIKVNDPSKKICTINSLGASAIRKVYGNKIQLDPKKYKKHVDAGLKTGVYKPTTRLEDAAFHIYATNIKSLIDLYRVNLCMKEHELRAVIKKYDMLIIDNEVDIVMEVLKWGYHNIHEIDYIDQIWWPVTKKSITYAMDKYDFIFVDECQDLSACQRELVMKSLTPNGRFVAVGDPHQCQPGDTVISMAGGGTKLLKDIKVGDRVIAYNSSDRGTFIGHGDKGKGRIVTQVSKRKYNGQMFVIGTESSKTSKYTANHHCIVRFNDDLLNGKEHVVYLMQKGSKFRIGVTSLFNNGGLGVAGRLRMEKADAYWILKILPNKSQALFFERVLSIKFGIPTMVFVGRTSNTFTFSQEEVDAYYTHFKDVDLMSNAIACLNDNCLNIKYPFAIKNGNKFGGRKSSFVMYAQNLASVGDYLSVAEYNESSKPNWCKIAWTKIDNFRGCVYSLEIEKDHNYIGDKILTHNCIYGFAGADSQSFQKIQQIPNTVTLPLSVCYRCDEEIIELAQTLVPHIQARPGAGKGTVDRDAKLEHILDGDMVVCRNTAPLVSLCMRYISEGTKAYVVGKDVGANLINLVKKTNRYDMPEVFKKLDFDLKYLGEKLIESGVDPSELEDESSYSGLQDKIAALRNIAGDEQGVDIVLGRIEAIFKDDQKDGICLSTVHKAKGLESERVFIICEDCFYNKRSMRIDWMAEQEHNLVYVAYTRAKHLLGFVQDFKF